VLDEIDNALHGGIRVIVAWGICQKVLRVNYFLILSVELGELTCKEGTDALLHHGCCGLGRSSILAQRDAEKYLGKSKEQGPGSKILILSVMVLLQIADEYDEDLSEV
jgi:hypothetical protein